MHIAYDYARYHEGQPSAGSKTKLPINTAYMFNSDEESLPFVVNPGWRITTTSVSRADEREGSIPGSEFEERESALVNDSSHLVCSTVKHREMAERIAFDADSFDRFAFILSHKLRAPVANALGLVELLSSAVVSDAEKKSCEEYLCIAVRQIDLEISKLNSVLLEYRERSTVRGRNRDQMD